MMASRSTAYSFGAGISRPQAAPPSRRRTMQPKDTKAGLAFAHGHGAWMDSSSSTFWFPLRQPLRPANWLPMHHGTTTTPPFRPQRRRQRPSRRTESGSIAFRVQSPKLVIIFSRRDQGRTRARLPCAFAVSFAQSLRPCRIAASDAAFTARPKSLVSTGAARDAEGALPTTFTS